MSVFPRFHIFYSFPSLLCLNVEYFSPGLSPRAGRLKGVLVHGFKRIVLVWEKTVRDLLEIPQFGFLRYLNIHSLAIID